MKAQNWVLCASLAVGVLLSGCGKSGDSGSAGGTSGAAPGGSSGATAAPSVKVDTSALETAFASAEAGTKSAVESAVSAIKSADYSTALTKLQGVLGSAKLTPEQESAVKSLIDQVKKAQSASHAGE